jgi:ABC-2 type transport system ATP-binding protein
VAVLATNRTPRPTTTLKLLTGLLKPTRGEAWLLGESIERVSSRQRLGFLPEQPYFYEYLNGVEYLELTGCLSGLAGEDARQRAKRWLGRVGLGDRPRLLLRKYSKGMLQRLGLASALLHDPELIILDEPMSGLDPFGRRDVRDLSHEQRERGTTVVFSSHILPDVETLCDRVAIVLHGRLTRLATVGELAERQPAARRNPLHRQSGDRVPGQPRGAVERRERPFETVFVLADDTRLNATLASLLQARAEIRAVTPQRATLEELFMAAARDDVAATGDERRSA